MAQSIPTAGAVLAELLLKVAEFLRHFLKVALQNGASIWFFSATAGSFPSKSDEPLARIRNVLTFAPYLISQLPHATLQHAL